METQRGALILADISGYTNFTRMHFTSLLHAEEIISELLDAVITAAEFPLQVTQLEGDAVLLVAEVAVGREAEACRDVARQVKQLFAAFVTRERALIDCEAGCACDACNQIGQLNLKAVLHFGECVRQRVHNIEEVTGPDVKLLRTLIKAPIDAREYILMTQSFYQFNGGLKDQDPAHQTIIEAENTVTPIVLYYPMRNAIGQPLDSKAGPAFSLRLNQHAFARMFHRKPRADFDYLIAGRMNLIVYLLEGLQSAFNLIRRSFRRDRSKAAIAIKPIVLIMFQIDQPPNSAALDPIVAKLLTALIYAAHSPLNLNKLEGNAALLYAVAHDGVVTAQAVVQQVENIFDTFTTISRAMSENPIYSSDMQQAIQSLRCKVLLHFGEAAFKTIRHFDEIAGEDVILIHRLLKNTIDLPAYALLTDRFYQLSGGLSIRSAEARLETVESFGALPVWVYPFSQY